MMSGHNFFLFYMGVFFSGFILFPCILLMHFLMPRQVLDRYWKEPYMRKAELALFTDTIYAPMRTVMLMWVIAFPRFGKKRGITEANLLVPKGYRLASMILSIWGVGGAILIFTLTAGSYIYFYAIGTPVPLFR